MTIRSLPNLPPVTPDGEVGYVVVTRVDNPAAPRGRELIWEWRGGDMVFLDREFLLQTDEATLIGDGTLRLGPYTLDLLGTAWGSDSYVAVRKP